MDRVIEWEMVLRHDPKRWEHELIGFGLEDPDRDPAFDMADGPPPWVADIPFEEAPGGE